MSITTRTSSTIIDNSWSWIFSSSFLSATSDSIIKQQQLHSKTDDQAFWIWTAVGLGVYGLKLCTTVLQLYNVSSAWNQRCNGRNRRLSGNTAIEDQLPRTKQSLRRRTLQIEEALATKTYGELQNRNDNDDDNKITNPSQQEQLNAQNKECTTCALSCRESSTARKPTMRLPLAKTCAICLDDFENDDKIAVSTKEGACRHIFHKDCLQTWLENHTSCPTCRHRMLPDPEPMPWLLIPNR